MADSLCALGREPALVMNDNSAVSESGCVNTVCDSFKSALLFFNENRELCSNFRRVADGQETEEVPSPTIDVCEEVETLRGEELSTLFKTIVSEAEENDNIRKKRCTDRYDSSESSDSGVATLSCSESSGSSSSDITEPGSPGSPLSSSSSGCECSESPTPSKMAPNSAFPWNKRPSTEEVLIGSFDLKRLKVDEDVEAVLSDTDNNNCQVVKNGNLDSEEELKKLVLDRVKCCFRGQEAQVRKALFSENAPRSAKKFKSSPATPERLPQTQISTQKTDATPSERTQLVFQSGSSFLHSGAETPDSSSLSESASNGATPVEEPDKPTASLSSSRTIPADILSKTLVVKCENLSNLTLAQMPVKCGTNVFHLEPRSASASLEPSRLISDAKSCDGKPRGKVSQVSSSSASVQFRIPHPACSRRKLRTRKQSAAPSEGHRVPESSTNPFAFSRNFPGAYLLSPTYIGGHVVDNLPEIPLVPGGLSRFLSTGCIKKCSEPSKTYLTLRGVASIPIASPSGVAQATNTKTEECVVDKSKENEDSTYRLPLSIYSKLNDDLRQDSSCSSLDFSDSSNSCQDSPSTVSNSNDESNASAESAPILCAPKNIRFPKKVEVTPDMRYFQEEIVCRWKDCSADFPSNAALVEHLQTKHVKEETSGKMSSCFWEGCKCYGKPATNKGYLENHVITHAGKKPFSCIFQRCGLSFSSQGALARHVTQHFTDDDSTNAAKRTPDSPQCKPNKRKVKKLRDRKRPSAKPMDFFDSSALERLNEKFATDTLRRTQGIFNENDNGFSITLLSQVCAKRTEPSGTVRYLLRWFPRGIADEEWLTMDKIQGHKFVDMRTLAEEEKQLCLKYIFQDSVVPTKSSRKLIESNQNSS